jgi:hypothetical protein
MNDDAGLVLALLERVGIMHRTGEMRDGCPVWGFTPFGDKLRVSCETDGQFSAAVAELQARSANFGGNKWKS